MISQYILRHEDDMELMEDSFEYEDDGSVVVLQYNGEKPIRLYCLDIDENDIHDDSMFLNVSTFDTKRDITINKRNILTIEHFNIVSVQGYKGVSSLSKLDEHEANRIYYYMANSGDEYEDEINVIDDVNVEVEAGEKLIYLKPFYEEVI